MNEPSFKIDLFLARVGSNYLLRALANLTEAFDGDMALAVVFMAIGQAPVGFGLRLDACNTIKHDNCAIEHTQRTTDFDVEVDVAGRVDQVDLHIAPLHRGGRAVDGDAATALFGIEVHVRSAVVHFAHAVAFARVEQDAFAGGGLACVNVGNDADVANVARIVVCGAVHGESFRAFFD